MSRKMSKDSRTLWLILIFNLALLVYALAAVRTPYSIARLIEWLAGIAK